MIPICDAIRAARMSRNLSQREVAIKGKIPRTFVNKVENNRTAIKMTTFLKLSDAIGIEAWRILRYAYQHGKESQTAPIEETTTAFAELDASSPRHQ